MKPLYKHDCKSCRYYGSSKDLDIYICKSSVIARDGNHPSDNTSAPIDMLMEQNSVSYGDGIDKDQQLVDRFFRMMTSAVTNTIKRAN